MHPLKTALEDLLRTRKLQRDAPPLRGERRLSPLETGVPEIDGALGGGFPRGQVSEVFGPASSGRTGLVLAAMARVTSRGALGAWVDCGDRLDPASAAAAGVRLAHLLWLRGGRVLGDTLSAGSTLLGSGLFELVVLDLAGVPERELGRLPHTTFLRLQKMVEETTTSLLLLGDRHTSHGVWGASLALQTASPRFSGSAGPGHLFEGLKTEARLGHRGFPKVPLSVQAAH
jgi:hypothetical protein